MRFHPKNVVPSPSTKIIQIIIMFTASAITSKNCCSFTVYHLKLLHCFITSLLSTFSNLFCVSFRRPPPFSCCCCCCCCCCCSRNQNLVDLFFIGNATFNILFIFNKRGLCWRLKASRNKDVFFFPIGSISNWNV